MREMYLGRFIRPVQRCCEQSKHEALDAAVETELVPAALQRQRMMTRVKSDDNLRVHAALGRNSICERLASNSRVSRYLLTRS
jgi:hypothetical protein